MDYDTHIGIIFDMTTIIHCQWRFWFHEMYMMRYCLRVDLFQITERKCEFNSKLTSTVLELLMHREYHFVCVFVYHLKTAKFT